MGNPASDDPPDFTLTDSDGEEHDYHVVPHDPSDGVRITVQLSEAMSGPVGELFDGLIGPVLLGDQSLDEINVEEALEGVEFDRVAAALSDSLDEDKVAGMVKQILRNTYRDEEPLGEDPTFEDAFRQNYLEMYRALWEVVRFNGFFGSFGS